jgi:hypothetical protein
MSMGVSAIVSLVGGAVLAFVAVFGGVSALTGASNPESASETVVSYDGS